MTREVVALGPPGARSLDGFPGWSLTTRRRLLRGHRTANGAWWFASSGRGRFDLDDPHGTCYVAFDERTAIRETAGEVLASLGVITDEFATERSLSELRIPTRRQLADTCAETAADFGVTRELCTVTPYDVPRQWATTLAAQFDGVRYQSRFTTGSSANAAALFGPAGARDDWPADDAPEPFAAAARRCGFTVGAMPRAVRIVQPPGQ
ncbi:RES domain-containing protein [Rhodococcus sp. AG1013]|uniref:RES family NAD+ phosphorylase n=1 Tax=Rhodococcus sp. AG1013 TaxID=2183996 RepID=UPI000E0C346F|nr:RES family NAD+ phosphorylase [Rhodococcus sp. AG1013]RDI18033.1 RES domain-containing protein [Rhodococcus sp. AG1013]